jgi:hypothetical protein
MNHAIHLKQADRLSKIWGTTSVCLRNIAV